MDGLGYARRSARIIFGDKTWWWRALAVAAMGVIPLLGPFIVVGYGMVLMRSVAWGDDSGLPPFSGGEIGRRALDGFVVTFVWSLLLVVPLSVYVVTSVFRAALATAGTTPPVTATPWWFSLAVSLGGLVLSLIMNVAVLRAAIYLSPSAGLKLSYIIDFIRRFRPGYLRVSGLMLLVSALGIVLAAPGTYLNYVVQLSPVVRTAVTYGSALVVGVLMSPLRLMVYCAYGLWARDTDPSSWPPLGTRQQLDTQEQAQTD